MAEPLAVGLIGCGRWGRNILRDLLSLGCRVSVVARSEASRADARELGAADVVEHTAELPEVAGVVVCTPTGTHAAVAEELLPRGVPLFVEKPFTANVADARRLAAAAPERIFVMHKWRYHPGIEALAAFAAGGELGAARGLRLSHLQHGMLGDDVDPVWHLVVHPLSIVVGVLGDIPPILAAVAEAGEGPGWADGLSALLGPRPWVALQLSARCPGRRREYQLVCDEGTASLDHPYAPALRIHRPGHDVEERAIDQELPLLRELREFVAHLCGGPPPRCGVREALLVVETVAALRERAGLPGDCPPR